MVTLIMLMPVPIMLLIILLLQTNAIQPRYNLEEDVDELDGLGRKVSRMVMLTMLIMLLMMPLQDGDACNAHAHADQCCCYRPICRSGRSGGSHGSYLITSSCFRDTTDPLS